MNKLRVIPQIIVGLILLLASGCATVTRGTKDTLVVESDPAGADIRLSTGQVGKTPTSFKLSRGDSLVVTISKEGYETVTVNVTPQVVGAGAAGMAGNVLVGGLIGAGVDALSGAMKDLKPNPVSVRMVKLENRVAEKETTVGSPSLVDKLKELKSALDSGLLTKDEYDRERGKLLETAPVTAPVTGTPDTTDKTSPTAVPGRP